MNLKPRRAILALIALLSTPAAAQEQAIARPPLWKVSDADTTIYLFGTIHALPKGVNWLQGPVAAAVDSSDELVTELPVIDPTRMQSLIAETAILPKGTTLRSLLPEDERTKLEAALVQAGLPPESFDPFEPWFAYFVLFRVQIGRQGLVADQGVEEVLTRRMVNERHLTRLGLETIEYQLGIFDRLPLAMQRKLLQALIEAGPTLRDDLGRIVKEWSGGDPEALAKLLNEDEDEPELIEALLVNRNREWAAWLRTRLEQPGTAFVAVGAGHLAGAGSVQEQLGKLGIKIERVQ